MPGPQLLIHVWHAACASALRRAWNRQWRSTTVQALSRHELLRQARLRSRCAHGSRQSAQVQGACAALTALAGVLSPGNIQLAASCSHHASPEASRCAGSPSRSLSILRAFRATISPVFRLRALSAGQASAQYRAASPEPLQRHSTRCRERAIGMFPFTHGSKNTETRDTHSRRRTCPLRCV